MVAGDWNILAGRLQGDGSVDIVETELPLDIKSIDRNLSSPSGMEGSITHEVKRLKVRGRPIFEPWNTVLIAEASGVIRGMSIYQKPEFNGAVWTLNQIGLAGYPLGMPYDGEVAWVRADPLDMFRHIWAHLQGFPAGNLGVTVSDLTSPVRIGTEAQQNEFAADPEPVTYGTVSQQEWDSLLERGWKGRAGDSAERLYPPPSETQTVSFESGPRKWNWWSTPDLGKVIDDLAAETPFDWVEEVYWDGDQPHCHIDLGHPTIGGRKDHLRFVLGENLATEPGVTEADYVNQTLALGAGEGRDRVRGYAGVSDGRLRRVRVVDDKGLSSVAQANSRAQDELNATRGQLVVDELVVFDHPNAPLEAIELGDAVPLYADMDWATVDSYVRVVGKSESPEKSDSATLTVVRMVQA